MVNKKISKGEVLFYLEEMMGMEMASETEENLYFDIKDGVKLNKDDVIEVRENMHHWYETKF